jgi:hypothetical protein
MVKKYWKLTALSLGVIFDFLFWKKNPGISYAIFIVLTICASYMISKVEIIFHSPKNSPLLIPIIFFSIMTFIRRNPFISFLNYLLPLFFLSIYVITFQNGEWIYYRLVDYINNFFRLSFNILKFPLFRASSGRPDSPSGSNKSKNTKVWSIFRGILLATPILIIFSFLFSSADIIFEQKTIDIFSKLNLQNLPETLFRGGLILLTANILIGFMFHASTESQKIFPAKKPIFKKLLGFTEACIVIGSVFLLFLLFISIQFQYYFFPKNNIVISGLTFAEYARRGFFELVVIAVLTLFLLLGLNTFTSRNTNSQEKLFTILNIGLLISMLIILASSFQRLLMYESAFGFTQFRTYAHVFMIWLGILLISVVFLENINQEWAIVNAAILVLVGFSVSLNLMNVDAFIAHQNIQRAKSGKDFDVTYLSSLTVDAVPTLTKEYSSSDTSGEIRDDIGAVLVCFQAKKILTKTNAKTWQSFHISDWKAIHKLETIEQHIEEYKIQEEDWFTSVYSPAGNEYTCADFSFID